MISGVEYGKSFAQYVNLLDFTGVNGSVPSGTLISDGTFLYGMTTMGGVKDAGVIFKIRSDGIGYEALLNFSDINGSAPYGSLISDGTFLYGMTAKGGKNGYGVIFKIRPDGTRYSKLLDFNASNGATPKGSFFYDGTFLYGMTSQGGINNMGTIFKIRSNGSEYLKLLDFAGGNGSNPHGTLISDGTFLYGMTSSGGTNNVGTVFRIKPDGTGYNSFFNFAGTSNGNYPLGSLISEDGFFYGMTYQGGLNNLGVVFRIKKDGTGYSKLLDFAGNINGSHPMGSLISIENLLYGMTYNGGIMERGVLFKIKTDGNGYSKLYDFATNGITPIGSLFSDSSFLYGMASQGGINNMGALFKYALVNTGTSWYSEKDGAQTYINVYPTLSSGKFTVEMCLKALNIECTREGLLVKVEIYNVSGEKVYDNINNQTSKEIDLNDFANGMYFVKIYDGDNVHLEKIVKQ